MDDCAPDVPACALSRRRFVGASVGVLIAGCGPAAWKTHRVAVPDSRVLSLQLSDYPELAAPGGMIALRASGERKPIIVMRLEGETFSVLSSSCTHMGCVVRWDHQAQNLRCPCHGSQFGDDGAVLRGPAKRPLTRYPYQLIGAELQISLHHG